MRPMACVLQPNFLYKLQKNLIKGEYLQLTMQVLKIKCRRTDIPISLHFILNFNFMIVEIITSLSEYNAKFGINSTT